MALHKGVIAVLAGVALTLPACSSGDSGSKALAVTVSEPSAGKVTMTATGTVKAGQVTVTLKNNGKSPHDAQLIRVEGKHTQDEVKKVVTSEGDPIPDWLHAEGGVSANPGETASATVVLTAGSYYVIDTNSDDNDKYYADMGAIKTFTVKGKAEAATAPAADVTITAKEYSFGVPALTAGSPTVKFENTGKEIHLLVAAPISAGKTINDVRAAFSNQSSTAPPPLDFDKAVQFDAVDPGKTIVTKVNLTKGSYAFICFITDRTGGAPHFTKGMLQEVKVA